MKKLAMTLALLFVFTIICGAFAQEGQSTEGKKVKLGGKELLVDEEGYLLDWTQWDKKVAVDIAKEDGIELTDAHWEVIDFVRTLWVENQELLAVRQLTKKISRAKGPDKGNTKYLYDLFPNGPAKGAAKIAGLRKPAGCI